MVLASLFGELVQPPRADITFYLAIPRRPVVIREPHAKPSQFFRRECLDSPLNLLNRHEPSVPQDD
jgi:hypothetical protein